MFVQYLMKKSKTMMKLEKLGEWDGIRRRGSCRKIKHVQYILQKTEIAVCFGQITLHSLTRCKYR